MNELTEHIANEWYVVRHSGELPEVALHSSIYYLTTAKEGPGLVLTANHLLELQLAALERYREIILRDLLPENRETTMYRGVKRSIINYQRYTKFCQRQGLDPVPDFPEKVGNALLNLLRVEIAEASNGIQQSVINCTSEELFSFAKELNVSLSMLPDGLAALCHRSS